MGSAEFITRAHRRRFGFPPRAAPTFITALNTFDRHLLREWLQILGLVLAATCGLLLLQVLYDDLRDLREIGARGMVLWTYLIVTVPSFLAIVLQLSLLVSLLFVLGKLHRANELTVMRAAGVGFMRMTAPIWIVGLFCCGLTWLLNTTVVPWSIERKTAMFESLQFSHESKKGVALAHIGEISSVAFDNQLARRMWFFNRFSKAARRGYGVSVSELDPLRRETRRILAAEAWRDPVRGWVFVRGRELMFSPENGEQTGSRAFAELVAPKYNEDPDLMLLIDRRPVDLSIYQLQRLIDHLEVERSPKVVPYAVRYFGLIADTLGPLIIIAIAIPFAVTGVRVNPAVGVSKSLGLFFLYYLFSVVASALATHEVLAPVVAAWLPNCGMALLALWLFARLR